MSLKGIDVSHWNESLILSMGTKWVSSFDFVIMKATEGITYCDKYMGKYVNMLFEGKANPLYGFYHFARPDKGNSAIAEADYFITRVSSYNGRALYILDVEAEALKVKNLDQWVYDWAKTVYDKTGVLPLIYCSEAECKRFKKAAELGCGLWVAKWSEKKPTKISPWKFYAIWQYKVDKVFGHSLDLDLFNGTEEAFRKYCAIHNKDVISNG